MSGRWRNTSTAALAAVRLTSRAGGSRH